MKATCLKCGCAFETIEVKVLHFTFPGSRYCEVCRQAEEVEQAESQAAARFVRTGVPLAYRDCSFATFRRVPGTGDALTQAGASLGDVVRTVAYVTSIEDMPLVARAHAEAFGAIRPAATIVEVAKLADPKYLVELQVDAYVEAK